tara:strand:+ start:182 stop:361 length:180 start_codon:yes stop_codon:yes gene_type:complete
MINVPITFDEAYQFIKLYDTLRDMNFELNKSQQNVFEKIQAGDHYKNAFTPNQHEDSNE